MPRRLVVRRLIPTALVLLSVSFATSLLRADNNGRTGKTQSPQGCNCHGTLPTGGVSVSITGPQQVQPLSTHSYTISVSGGPSSTLGGFGLRPTAGTLVAGTTSRVSGGELVHNSPDARSWTFQWTAPAAPGTVNVYAVGLAADGTGDEDGDSWNWYGGALNTAFAIDVSNSVDAPGTVAGTWLAAPTPNPLVSRADISFSLASAGDARLEAYDASGRRVATIANGVLAAGRHTVAWAGLDDAGSPLPGGLYFLRLVTGDRSFRTRVNVVR